MTNWVASAWKSELVYDAQHRLRISRDYGWQGGVWVKTNEVRLFYDGVVVIQERDSSNAPLTSYTRSGSYLLARTDNTASSHAYYHTDGNRNVTALVNSNQLIVAKHLYDPFGSMLAMSGPLAEVNLYRFASQRYHANSGLSLYLRRAYSPALQRFINRDPIEEMGGRNLYNFVGNNPVSLYDPLGLAWYDDVAAWWRVRVNCSKSILDNNTHWLLAGLGDTVLDIGLGFASIPQALGHFGEGTGTFSADPTLENSVGLVSDFNLAMSFALPIATKFPAGAPTATQLEFGFVNGNLSGRLTAFSTATASGETSALQKLLAEAKPTIGHPNQVMATLEDGTRVLFRKDFGSKAHGLGGPFKGAGKIDHYNIEVQASTGKQIKNVHIVPDGKGGFILF